CLLTKNNTKFKTTDLYTSKYYLNDKKNRNFLVEYSTTTTTTTTTTTNNNNNNNNT
ncbi:unnamed protein product, partial [Schistosoma margrebowiei]